MDKEYDIMVEDAGGNEMHTLFTRSRQTALDFLAKYDQEGSSISIAVSDGLFYTGDHVYTYLEDKV